MCVLLGELIVSAHEVGVSSLSDAHQFFVVDSRRNTSHVELSSIIKSVAVVSQLREPADCRWLMSCMTELPV